MKYSQWIGIAAAALLVASCFMPWAWYPDLKMDFTGFYSYQNYYGKPGKLFSIFAGLSVVFFLIPRLWAKLMNLFVNAFVVGYAIYCFISFSRCYSAAICPEKRIGIYLMLAGALIMLVMSLLPGIPVDQWKKTPEPVQP